MLHLVAVPPWGGGRLRASCPHSAGPWGVLYRTGAGGGQAKGIVSPQHRSLEGVLYRTGAVARWFSSTPEKGQGRGL